MSDYHQDIMLILSRLEKKQDDNSKEIQSILVAFARAEEKREARNALWNERFGALDARMEANNKSLTRQGERIGALEASEDHRKGERKVLTGVVAVIGTLFGFIGSVILKVFGVAN